MIVYKLLRKNHFLSLKLAIVTILLMCALPASASNNEWTAIGLAGSTVEVLVINPTTPDMLYAGTMSGGVFVTTFGPNIWTIFLPVVIRN